MFLVNISHIHLNYAFLIVWNIFGKIHWKVLFLVKKWLSQKEAQNYTESLFCSTILKRMKSRGKFGFCIIKCFLIKPEKKGQILPKTLFLLQMCYQELNYAFLLIWSTFWLNLWKLLILVKKVISLKEAQKYIENLFFSTSLKS